MIASQAYVSLVTNDDYAKGALVLGKSLRNTNTCRKLVLMLTSGVSQTVRDDLLKVWDDLIDVTLLDSHDKEKLTLMQRPELGCTFSKLRAWTLTQFSKCVFLDADTMVMQNVDDLFERNEFSAAPDIGWPDCFNSGVFVFQPDLDTYDNLLKHAQEFGSFDGGDQGLLNEYFNSWATKDISHHLPFIYNMVSNISYTYAPAFRRYGQDVKIVHFLGAIKPWHHSVNSNNEVQMVSQSNYTPADHTFHQMWWDLHLQKSDTSDQSDAPLGAVGGENSLPQSWQHWQDDHSSIHHGAIDQKGSWEKGLPDYLGEDKFDNILNHIKQVIDDDIPRSEETSINKKDKQTSSITKI